MLTAGRPVWFLSSLPLLLVVSSCATSPGQIEIVNVPAPGAAVSAGRRGDYEAALTAIVDAFDRAVGLPRPDAALVVFPSPHSFEQGLLELGYTPALARSASTFNAIGGAKAVLVNGAVVGRFDRAKRVRLLAHELVHTIQYRFGGGIRGASEQWLREGFAEWIACRITAHLGLGSFALLREEVLGALVGVDVDLLPAPFARLATFAQWVEAQDRYEAPLYAQAFIAAELLIEMRDVPTLVRYFERFRSTTEYQRVFTETFGLDRAAFERLFLRRWRETVTQFSVRRE